MEKDNKKLALRPRLPKRTKFVTDGSFLTECPNTNTEIVNNGPKCLTGSQTSLKNLNKLKKTSNFTDPVNLLRPRLFQSYFTSTISYIPRQGSLSLNANILRQTSVLQPRKKEMPNHNSKRKKGAKADDVTPPPSGSASTSNCETSSLSQQTESQPESKTNNDESPRKTKKMSVLDKIVYSIRSLKDGPNGSSRQALAKFLKSEFDYDNSTAIKKAYKLGIQKGILTQIGNQRFRVATDKYDESTMKLNMDTTVQMEDIMIGQGDQKADHGDIVTIKYVGILEDGTEFDSAKSFTFLLGAGEVIKGMDKGVMGMTIGGRRKIVIPSKLGYGKRGSPPEIPPNAVLQFEITLRDIQRV